MKTKDDYVTKKDLNKAVEDITQVIRDGFSLAATKTEVNERFDRVDTRFDKIEEKLESIKFNVASHDERISKLERHRQRHPTTA